VRPTNQDGNVGMWGVATGGKSCQVGQVGMVDSGKATLAMGA